MTQSVGNISPSVSLFRLVGYSLLALALFDFVHTLVPLQFLNPSWEFQTVGALVERVPVPLLGLILIFYGEENFRKKWEFNLLKLLSWVSLLIGLLFILLIPLLVFNTSRLNNQLSTQAAQPLTQLQQLENQINNGTEQDIKNIATRLNQGRPVESQNVQELKNRLLSELAKAKKTVQPQTETALADRRLALLKNSTKWLLGALVSAAMFIYIWSLTRWARLSIKSRKKV